MKRIYEYLKESIDWDIFSERHPGTAEIIEDCMKEAQKDAYNKAIDDAAECLYDDELKYIDPHDYSCGVESVENSGKKEILNLKI